MMPQESIGSVVTQCPASKTSLRWINRIHQFALNPWMIVTTPPCTMQRGQSVRETFSHYWSMGGMQED